MLSHNGLSRLSYQTDCQQCSLREQCLASGAKGDRARRESRVRRLLPAPAVVARKPILLGALRLSWMWPVERFAVPGPPDFRRQYVEVLPLTQTQPEAKPPPRPPRAVRQASSLALAGSARTQRLVGTSTGAHHGGFRTRVSRHQRALGGIGRHRSFSKTCHLPSELIMRAKDLCLPATTSLSCLMLAGNARGNAASSQQTRMP